MPKVDNADPVTPNVKKNDFYQQLAQNPAQTPKDGVYSPLLQKAIHDADCETEARMEDSDEWKRKLDKLVKHGSQREWRLQVELFWYYCKSKGYLMFEIWIMIFLFFYSDVVLDFRMMKTFLHYGDHKFIICTMGGIYTGVLFTLSELTDKIPEDTPTWVILVTGFLLPFQLHVAFLCCYSTYKGKVHPMIYSSRFAEAVIEATVSAAVQTYALIYRDYDATDIATGYLSVSLSYMSIAYAFTDFDRRQGGMRGIPGVSNGWTFKLLFVFLFRTCEIVSRLATVLMFQLAVRNETIYHNYGIGVNGAVTVFAIDGLVMFWIIFFHQYKLGHWKNLLLCIPSTISWTNPMLLMPNAFTMSSSVYYTVRVLELCVMASIAWKVETFHGGHGHFDYIDGNSTNNLHGLVAFRAEFYNDQLVFFAAIISTVIMMLSLPIIRLLLAEHVMLLDRAMFVDHPFSNTEDTLCENLLNYEKANSKNRPRHLMACERFHHIAGGLIAESSNKLAIAMKEHRRFRRSDETLTLDQPKSIESSTSGNTGAGAGAFCINLEKWLEKEYLQAEEEDQERRSRGHLFLESVCAGHNLHKWLKSEEDYLLPALPGEDTVQGNRMHLEYLMILNQALSGVDSHEVRKQLEDASVCRMLLRVIPEWRSLDSISVQGKDNSALLLFEEKCKLTARVMQTGWELQSRMFMPTAREFNKAFDAKIRSDVEKHVPDQPGLEDEHDWVLRLQMHALVEMYTAVPKDFKSEWHFMSCPTKGLFRKDKEMRAIADGAEVVKQCRDAPIQGYLRNTEEFTHSDALKFVLSVLKDDLKLRVDWDKRWQLHKLLNVLTTYHEVLKLTKVTTKPKCKSEEDFKEEETLVSKMEEVRGLFETDADGRFTMDFNKFDVIFTFKRLKELEPQPVERLKNHWPVNQTAMLKLVSSMPPDELEGLCYGGPDDPTQQAFRDYRDMVERDAIGALNDQFDRMKAQGQQQVDPNTAVGAMTRYRMKKAAGHADLAAIKSGKASSQSALTDYEEVNEKLLDHLKDMMRDPDKFSWSANVCKHIGKIETDLRVFLKNLRKDTYDFWNKEDGELQRDEKKRRSDAEEKMKEEQMRAEATGQAAQEQQERADEAIKEAQEEARKAKEKEDLAMSLLQKAQQQMQEAEDEKKTAFRAREQAEKAQEDAKRERKEAFVELGKVREEKIKLELQKENMGTTHSMVVKALKLAKQNGSDVSWFEPFLSQFSEVARGTSVDSVGAPSIGTSSAAKRSSPMRAASASHLS